MLLPIQLACFSAMLAIASAKKRPRKGQKVRWRYSGGTAEGTVERIAETRIEIETGDTTIVRNGTPDDPAVVIRQDDNPNRILRLVSELL